MPGCSTFARTSGFAQADTLARAGFRLDKLPEEILLAIVDKCQDSETGKQPAILVSKLLHLMSLRVRRVLVETCGTEDAVLKQAISREYARVWECRTFFRMVNHVVLPFFTALTQLRLSHLELTDDPWPDDLPIKVLSMTGVGYPFKTLPFGRWPALQAVSIDGWDSCNCDLLTFLQRCPSLRKVSLARVAQNCLDALEAAEKLPLHDIELHDCWLEDGHTAHPDLRRFACGITKPVYSDLYPQYVARQARLAADFVARSAVVDLHLWSCEYGTEEVARWAHALGPRTLPSVRTLRVRGWSQQLAAAFPCVETLTLDWPPWSQRVLCVPDNVRALSLNVINADNPGAFREFDKWSVLWWLPRAGMRVQLRFCDIDRTVGNDDVFPPGAWMAAVEVLERICARPGVVSATLSRRFWSDEAVQAVDSAVVTWV